MKDLFITKRYLNQSKDFSIEGLKNGNSFTRHGDVTVKDENGKVELTGRYSYGKPIGEWIHWHENGKVESTHRYVDGLLNGSCKQYWDNGTLAREGSYKGGYPEGEHKMYDRQKKLVRRVEYKRKKIVKAKLLIKDKWLEYDLSNLLLKLPWKPIFERICLNQSGALECMSVLELWEKLLTSMDPDEAEEMLQALNDLYGELGLDENNGIITSCAGTFVATSVQDGNSKQSGRPGGNVGRGSLTQQEVGDIVNACKAKQRGQLAGYGIFPNVKGDPGTAAAVDHMDTAVANCQDHGNSMIADVWDDVGSALSGVWNTVAEVGSSVLNAASDAVDRVFKTDRERDEETDPPDTVYTESDTGNVIVVHATVHGFPTEVRIYNYDGSWAAPTRFMTDEERGRAPYGYIDIPGVPGIPGVDTPVDESGMSKCEQLAQTWERIKEYCSQPGNDWQSYNCQEILRVFTGCADSALVYPTPEGGLGCPLKSGMTDEEFRAYECKRKQMIWNSGAGGRKNLGQLNPDARGTCMPRGSVSLPELGWADQRETDPPRPGPEAFIVDENEEPGLQQEGRESSHRSGRGMASRYSQPAPSLSQYSSLNALDDQSFEKAIGDAKGKFDFVVFASKSCGPCHKVLDVFHQQSGNFKNATFSYVDVGQNPELYAKFEIRYTPTIVVFKNGKVVGQRRVGAASRDVLTDYIKRSIAIGDSLQPAIS
jgi:thiol-disulfide isomerase/thioredoxin